MQGRDISESPPAVSLALKVDAMSKREAISEEREAECLEPKAQSRFLREPDLHIRTLIQVNALNEAYAAGL
jgi:hypothetical protein